VGWKKHRYGTETRWEPNGACAGWVNVTLDRRIDVYLNLDVAYQVAARIVGEPLAVAARTLKQRLRDDGLLAAVGAKGSGRPYTVQKVVKGAIHDVIHLKTAALFPPPLNRKGEPMVEHGLLLRAEPGDDEDLDGQTSTEV